MLLSKKRKVDLSSNRELSRQVVATIDHTDDSAVRSNQNLISPDIMNDGNASQYCTPIDQSSSASFDLESDNYLLSDDSIDQIPDFQTRLAGAFLRTNMNHVQINAVLKTLRTHPCHSTLPKDARTVLKTSRIPCEILNVSGGRGVVH